MADENRRLRRRQGGWQQGVLQTMTDGRMAAEKGVAEDGRWEPNRFVRRLSAALRPSWAIILTSGNKLVRRRAL